MVEGVTENFQHWPLATTGAGVTCRHSSAQQLTAAGPHLLYEVVLITGEINFVYYFLDFERITPRKVSNLHFPNYLILFNFQTFPILSGS